MRLDVQDLEDLRPLVEQVVDVTISRLEGNSEKLGGRLAVSEAEAAALVGVARHVLRDARLRGELIASRVGRGVVYEKTELLAFLKRRRT